MPVHSVELGHLVLLSVTAQDTSKFESTNSMNIASNDLQVSKRANLQS